MWQPWFRIRTKMAVRKSKGKGRRRKIQQVFYEFKSCSVICLTAVHICLGDITRLGTSALHISHIVLLCNTLLTIFYHTFEALFQACANPGNRLIRMICSNVAGIAGVKQQQEHCEAVAEDLVLPIPAPVASASSAPSSSFVTSVADCHGENSCAIMRPEMVKSRVKKFLLSLVEAVSKRLNQL